MQYKNRTGLTGFDCAPPPPQYPTQEVFTEMEEKYGEVEEMNVCDNLGDHLVGNVYVKVCFRILVYLNGVELL